MSGHHEPNPIHEVQDMEKEWIFFESLFGDPVKWTLPSIDLGFMELRLTKFMILQLIAAGLILLIYIPLARRIASGALPTGRFWNFFEALLVFVRDEIARPNLDQPAHEGEHHDDHGHHQEHTADSYVPFLWTLFLFVLFCNLLGMLPMMGSPTASIWVTGALAMISFVVIHASAIRKHGFTGYLFGLWPKLDIPFAGVLIGGLIWGLELLGMVIKAFVLAVRLFANMFAGHMVLAYIIFLIYLAGNLAGLGLLWGGVTIVSVLAVVALSLLELFVAFLQAYVFTFLTALFLGMSLHGEH
jgi:F-type H+-transporting ATPase subunit a